MSGHNFQEKTMITLRKAVAIAATSALALVGVASTATAQTAQSTLTVNVKTTGPAPATITGYTVTTTCRLLAGSLATQDAVSVFPVTGGSLPQVFSLTASSNCSVKVTANGSGGGAGLVNISIGGTSRATGQLGATLTVDQGAANSTAVTGPTTIDITVAFPSITVKKVVVGEEVTPGAEYPMQIICLDGNSALRTYGSSLTNGLFTLKAGASKTFTGADIAFLVATDTCHVAEISGKGAAGTTYGSTNSADATIAGGIILPATGGPFAGFNYPGGPYDSSAAGIAAGRAGQPTFVSAGTKADNQTVTVTNSFIGDLIVSKVVVGDPKSNIAVYEVSVSCNNNGPRETFLLKDRQSKIFTGIASGTSCLVSESRSDGATASYSDNSGDNATDGRVTIKGTASGCIDSRLSAYPDCRANVIITNSYVPATTTAAATTAAPATQAPATAAPVAPAPVEEPAVLDDTEVVTG
jgi:hypothetical protein